ncbi:MAG: primosomal protein N', partial [Pseudomonadota bacterium]
GDLPAVGSRVLVPFGPRRLVGLVVGHSSTQSEHALKPILKVLDAALIDSDLIGLARWCAHYYCFPPGELVSLLLPTVLRRNQGFRPPAPSGWALTDAGRAADLSRSPKKRGLRQLLQAEAMTRESIEAKGFKPSLLRSMQQSGWVEACEVEPTFSSVPGPELNVEQRLTSASILRARRRFRVLLLAGITGSGKTEVYLRAARPLLAGGGQVLVLVPEIGLTPQLLRRFQARLGHRAWVYHSDLSEGERLACWQAAQSGRARLIIGTRSAAFLPLKQLALIVVDEEHDPSFKQQEGARYHGRDVAVLRAQRQKVPIVLGSATPSLESLNNADSRRYELLKLTQRAGPAIEPRWQVMDQRGQAGPLHENLLHKIKEHVSREGQVLLYRNRRGYAPVLMCNACGWSAECERCSAHMTWHQSGARLQCHHCGASRPEPRRCPECHDPNLQPLGAGTERLELLLKERFPETRVHRVDRDELSRKHDFETLLAQVREGGPCILVGTQMLAKGHHLPGVTLSAVLDVDAALFSADFRAPERLGQAVYQVAGRAGRAERAGEFILQTHHPEHPLLTQLIGQPYLNYTQRLLEERRLAGLPPSAGLALIRAEAHQPEPIRRFLLDAASVVDWPGIEITGPVPALMTRRGGYWRFQLWLQSADKQPLADRLDACMGVLHKTPSARQVRWHVDMDPVDL